MKTKAIVFASVMLVGCHGIMTNTGESKQYTQSSSSVNPSEVGASRGIQTVSSRWPDHNNTEQEDLWRFIGDGMKMKVPDNNRIREQRNRFLRNKSYLHDVALRAEPYMYWIVEQIKQRDMPMELVLLPIVESAFDPHATSPANAAGLWQIVPQTGRNYGLKQNQWYDGRRDIAASTTVALDIMQRMNKMFNGDWLLTLAAFNSGERRVLQAIKANKRQGKTIDFWSLSLPRETSIYVPRMLALSDIIKNSQHYGITLPKPNKQRALARIDVGQQIQLTQAAEMAGMSLSTLKAYNPGYKRNITAPNGPHYIMLPESYVHQFKNSLATEDIITVDRKYSLNENNHRLVAPNSYKVRPGDTLSTIAKRLNISLKELFTSNNLSRDSKLKIGQLLMIAGDKKRATVADNTIQYRVRRGDSLSSIAKRHSVNIDDVMRWNNIITESSQLKAGDTLTLYIRNDLPPSS